MFLRVSMPISDIVKAILERGIDLGLLVFATRKESKPPPVVAATWACRFNYLPAVAADVRKQLSTSFRFPKSILPILQKMLEDVAAHRYFKWWGSKLQKMVWR